MLVVVLAFLPSPGTNAIHLGPLQVRLYGLMIALGVLAGVWLASRRWAARGGDPAMVATIATWAVPAGLVGARLYHVVTDYRSYEGRWFDVVAVWRGGLGIPGGIIAGIVTGIVVARRRGWPVADLLDAAVPALPLAQAIGRLGNYFNQELFGRPTRLPWALDVDVAHRPDRYLHAATFHPTFAYEAVWNLGLCAVLILLDRRRTLRPGSILWAYVLGYGLGRLWVEELRVDPASLILGVRVNLWVSGLAILLGGTMLLVRQITWTRPDQVEAGHQGDRPA
jgi:prolipoprotein diacylglyceryl transferase